MGNCCSQVELDVKSTLRDRADRLVQRAGVLRHLADSLPDNLKHEVKLLILESISN